MVGSGWTIFKNFVAQDWIGFESRLDSDLKISQSAHLFYLLVAKFHSVYFRSRRKPPTPCNVSEASAMFQQRQPGKVKINENDIYLRSSQYI